jgi:hypothetical protein
VTAWLAALPAGEVAAVRRVEGAALA